MIIFNPISELWGILLFFVPFIPVFKINQSGNVLFHFLTVIAIIRLLISRAYIKLSITKLLSIIFFMIYGLLISWERGIADLAKMFIYFVFILLAFEDNQKNDLRKILLYFSFGIILASTFGLFSNKFPGLEHYIGNATALTPFNGKIYRFSGLYPNPNHYTMDLSIALSAWASLLISGGCQKRDLLYVICLSIFGFMSISLSFLLSYAAIGIIIFVIYIKQGNFTSIIKVILVILAVFISLRVLITDGYISAIELRLANLENSDLSNITTGRSDILKNYLSSIFNSLKNFFFGQGLGASNLGVDSHNVYIELVYYLGVFGTLLYIICLARLCPIPASHFKKNILNYLPLIILLIRANAINLIYSDYLYFHVFIIFTVLDTDFALYRKTETETHEAYEA